MTVSRSNLAALRLIVFDLDGTLVDSKRDLVLSVNAMLEHRGRKTLAEDRIASYVGKGVRTLITRSLGGKPRDEEIEDALAFFLKYYRAHMLDNTRPYPGVRECLEGLRGRKLAVLTNKPVRFSRTMIAGLGLKDYFEGLYGGDSFPLKKPDATGLRRLMDETGVPPSKTMMVGDSDTDVLTGRNAGVWTCGVTYGIGSKSLRATPPDLLLDNLRDLPAHLRGEKVL